MYVALAWGFIAAASLIIGGLLALYLTISRRTLGYIMAFGGGVLISAIAYEQVEEAVATAAGGSVALGVFAGAIMFFGGDLLIDRLGGSDRKASSGAQAEGNTLPIVLGTVLDGVPESIVLGVSLLSGKISVAMLCAIFMSNLPEAIAGTTGLRVAGWRRGHILTLWAIVAAVSGLGAYLAELYPTRVRGAGQGFTYNVGRGASGLVTGGIGYLVPLLTLNGAIAAGASIYLLALAALLVLPETRGRDLAV